MAQVSTITESATSNDFTALQSLSKSMSEVTKQMASLLGFLLAAQCSISSFQDDCIQMLEVDWCEWPTLQVAINDKLRI